MVSGGILVVSGGTTVVTGGAIVVVVDGIVESGTDGTEVVEYCEPHACTVTAFTLQSLQE